MPQSSKSVPDPSDLPAPASRQLLDQIKLTSDFGELAARFNALSGGGFSPEISADLALEVVLNEIVEQACVATGATGAAIVLRRDGEMVCRASSGPTAPELGSRLDISSGLSGECVKTGKTQRTDDVLADSRADIEAAFQLGVRSVIVMPLQGGETLLGLFELLSSRPAAFEERDELLMEALAGRALSNLESASRPLQQPPPAAAPAPVKARPKPPNPRPPRVVAEEKPKPVRRFDWGTWLMGAGIVVCAVLLGILVAQHFALQRGVAGATAAPRQTAAKDPAPQAKDSVPQKTSEVVSPPPATNTASAVPAEKSAPPANKSAAATTPAPSAATAQSAPTSPVQSAPPAAKPGSAVPPGGLLVYEGGQWVLRTAQGQKPAPSPNAPAPSSGGQNAVSVSPTEAESSLVKRVEPDYPDQARVQGVQGAVVLEVKISPDGRVEDALVVRGSPLLTQASIAAVKQWRFKPRLVKGRPTAMQTNVTLNFRLPQP